MPTLQTTYVVDAHLANIIIKCAGLGVVVRDSAGLVIAALSQRVRLPGSADVVEALVACRAMRFA